MASSKKLLIILGITGTQGSSVAKAFQTSPNWRIRGITRDPTGPSNAALLAAGIELVPGDMNDQASLEQAFASADAIFSVTDFWQHLLDPTSPIFASAAAQNRAPNELAMEKEIQQGKNIIAAAAAAHAKKPLHRFVVSTLADAKKWSQGDISRNYHFDGKARYVEYLKQEFPDLAKVSLYIHIGYYLSNMLTQRVMTPHKDPSSDEWVFPTIAATTTAKYPCLDAAVDTGYFVQALIESAPAGTNMLGVTKWKTVPELAALWAEAMGVKMPRLHSLTLEEYAKIGLPEWMALELNDTARFVSEYGWTGGEPNVKEPEECGVDMAKLGDMEAWFRKQDWKV